MQLINFGEIAGPGFTVSCPLIAAIPLLLYPVCWTTQNFFLIREFIKKSHRQIRNKSNISILSSSLRHYHVPEV